MRTRVGTTMEPVRQESGGLGRRVTLSVLIPVYNEARTIAEALRRVLALDFSPLLVDLDVIVCDDASEDATRDHAPEFRLRPPR